MATLLGALLKNESGGRNIPNTHEGTSSGQAQGYFQITTGTWDDFGGRKYAANPMGATYQQQAEIASKIPLKRWDKSTLAAMQATGRPIDPNRTLGENLSMQGEGFGAGQPAQEQPVVGQQPGEASVADYRAGNAGDKPVFVGDAPVAPVQPEAAPTAAPMVAAATPPTADQKGWRNALAKGMAGFKMPAVAKNDMAMSGMASPAAARVDTPEIAPFDQNQIANQRQQLAMAMQKLNSGKLWL